MSTSKGTFGSEFSPGSSYYGFGSAAASPWSLKAHSDTDGGAESDSESVGPNNGNDKRTYQTMRKIIPTMEETRHLQAALWDESHFDDKHEEEQFETK